MLVSLFKENRRIRAVDRLAEFGGPRERLFEDYVIRAAAAFDAPISMLSLIRGDRQWFKATRGLDLDLIQRNDGFCTHVLDADDLIEVCAPEADERFRNNALVVGKPGVRYYLGAPLRMLDGTDVGALCVMDVRPRSPASADQRAYLGSLARQACRRLELRADVKEMAP